MTTSSATVANTAINGARRELRGGAGGGGAAAAGRGPRKDCGNGRARVSSPGRTSS